LADVAISSDFAIGHNMAEMPDFGSFTDLTALVYIG
jgi:hypothetical protein